MCFNVTVAGTQHGGTLTVFADGQPLPVEPNLAFSAGQTVSNLVIVPPGDGSIDFYNGSSGNIQVVADLEGFYTA